MNTCSITQQPAALSANTTQTSMQLPVQQSSVSYNTNPVSSAPTVVILQPPVSTDPFLVNLSGEQPDSTSITPLRMPDVETFNTFRLSCEQ